MTTLLELKEKLTRFYGKYDIYITPVIKFTVALTAFLLINHNIGYMEKISSTPIALILALICSILPVGGAVFIGSVLILLDMYALSVEVCIVALILFILMYILYFRFSPKNEYGVLLTPICFGLNIPFVMPVGMGLLRELYSMFSLVCGIVLYFFLNGVKQNETTLGGALLPHPVIKDAPASIVHNNNASNLFFFFILPKLIYFSILFAYYLSSILHLMPYHRILIIQLVVRTLFIMSLHQARSIILVHIHFAVIFLIIFIVYIVYTTVTARHNILQFLLPYFPYPVCCLSFTSDSSAEHYLHVEITSS